MVTDIDESRYVAALLTQRPPNMSANVSWLQLNISLIVCGAAMSGINKKVKKY